MKWRLIKQALCPLKARNPHKAGLLNPVSKWVYEPQFHTEFTSPTERKQGEMSRHGEKEISLYN